MFLSVVIPTCDRIDLLGNCLDGLAPGRQNNGAIRGEDNGQNPARPLFAYEIIVTDDGAGGQAREFVQKHYPWVKWVAGPCRGPAANRNNGAKYTEGEWIVFIDDDCLPDAGWLAAIWTHASSGEFDVIEGRTVIPDKVDNPFRQGVENLSAGNYWSCNLAVRRDTFIELKGFDEDFLEAGGEDMEFGYRIRKYGLRAVFEDRALVFHPTRRLGLKKLLARSFLIRWILLYQLKTGTALPAEASVARVVWILFANRVAGMMRSTIHLFTRPDRTLWRTRLFYQFWEWLLFPIMFPYLVKWEFIFRKSFFSIANENKQPQFGPGTRINL
jgi:GT2 family glycosyltransferase